MVNLEELEHTITVGKEWRQLFAKYRARVADDFVVEFTNGRGEWTELKVQQSDCKDLIDKHKADPMPTGGMVWDSAIILAWWMVKHPEIVRKKRVVELGAGGCGVPGLVAAHLGARYVTMTDLPTMLPQLQRNINRTEFTNVDAEVLVWPGSIDAEVVLMADIVYHEMQVQPLFECLNNIQCLTYWAQELHRGPQLVDCVTAKLSEQGWTVKALHVVEDVDRMRAPDIVVFCLTPADGVLDAADIELNDKASEKTKFSCKGCTIN
eukprot:gnl/MRDRNA2_/MRDRNA2_135927_c0_seq1.p1 gnl/MRDRNA2_/MRDRNA2_135927_c0~~gnl/MRDRNA2_/MRDRNA2_135927_c0_seq1.p1  ORF type:complete len:265 (+),score=53.85 gnl/MRDRNA2_/MRDRNA2_135927_c0_seq1:101-895(+)